MPGVAEVEEVEEMILVVLLAVVLSLALVDAMSESFGIDSRVDGDWVR